MSGSGVYRDGRLSGGRIRWAPPETARAPGARLRPRSSNRSSTDRSSGRPSCRATELVDRLLDATHVPVVSIVGPPGYGKTTLLSQWAERKGTRVAWLSIDERDNDPETLMTYAVEAIDRVEPVPPELRSPRRRRDVVAASAIPGWRAPWPRPANRSRSRSITSTSCRTPSASTRSPSSRCTSLRDRNCALGVTRRCRRSPVARMQAGGGIVEIGVDELAMNIRRSARAARGRGRRARRDADAQR